MARKGIWYPHGGRGAILELLDTHDHLGTVQRIDAGRPLGSLALDVLVWVCSRWRELGDREQRQVPLTLAGLAMDLGWRKGGGAAVELARSIDALTQATFRARVYNARLGETRIDTFGLIDRWERGERDRPGRRAHAGLLVLGDWLHQQLRRGHLTYVSWPELRALGSGTARRLLLFLDAERFQGVLRHPVDAALFATLGITAAQACHQRATLRRAAQEVTAAPNRYSHIAVEVGARRGEQLLVVHRDNHPRRVATSAVPATRAGQPTR
jgi:hypothetical protein